MTNLQTIGLLFDLVGILVLGVPLATVGVKTIIARSETYWDSNPNEYRRMLAERMDVGIGTVVLAFGFGMQIAGQYPSLATTPPLLGWSFTAVLVVFLTVYVAWLRKFMLARQLARIGEIMGKAKDDEDDPGRL